MMQKKAPGKEGNFGTDKQTMNDRIIHRNRNFINIPAIAHLASFPQWVGYRLSPGKNGRDEKIPVNPLTGKNAKPNDPDTWATCQRALQSVEQFSLDGVGFMLTKASGIVGGDIDNCINNGRLSDLAQQTVKALAGTYWEISPSGNGLRFFALGSLPPGRRKKPKGPHKFEIYDCGRFLTVTGSRLSQTADHITDQTEAIATLHRHIFSDDTPGAKRSDTGNSLDDVELLAKILNSKGSEKFLRLWNGDTTGYPTPSEADQALTNILCFWTNHDAERIDNLFGQSALYRQKWDRPDYAERTINNALETVKRGYTGVSQDYTQADDLVSECFAWANSRQWRGRTGLTDKAIYLAHLEIVRRTGKLTYHASCRELASGAGVGRDTATKANGRLRRLGLLTIVKPATSSMPNMFELVDIRDTGIFKSVSLTTHTCDNGMSDYETTAENTDNSLMVCPTLKQNSDLWRFRGLGKTGREIYIAMLEADRSMTQSEIAKASGRSKPTVSRKLKILIEAGMVDTDFGKYEALHVANETGIADLLGTLGASEKQKQKHKQERTAHKRKIDFLQKQKLGS